MLYLFAGGYKCRLTTFPTRFLMMSILCYCHCSALRPSSLAACSWAHQVQSCRSGVQGAPRLCAVVPWPVHLCCRPSKSPRALLFLQRLPRSASGLPLHCWQPSIVGCWPSGVELPATGGYVGTVSGDLSHSTRDVPLQGIIISCHFVWSDIFFYTLYIVF